MVWLLLCSTLIALASLIHLNGRHLGIPSHLQLIVCLRNCVPCHPIDPISLTRVTHYIPIRFATPRYPLLSLVFVSTPEDQIFNTLISLSTPVDHISTPWYPCHLQWIRFSTP
jgi:hypothetical protein